jgi:hypothetical protein
MYKCLCRTRTFKGTMTKSIQYLIGRFIHLFLFVSHIIKYILLTAAKICHIHWSVNWKRASTAAGRRPVGGRFTDPFTVPQYVIIIVPNSDACRNKFLNYIVLCCITWAGSFPRTFLLSWRDTEFWNPISKHPVPTPVISDSGIVFRNVVHMLMSPICRIHASQNWRTLRAQTGTPTERRQWIIHRRTTKRQMRKHPYVTGQSKAASRA